MPSMNTLASIDLTRAHSPRFNLDGWASMGLARIRRSQEVRKPAPKLRTLAEAVRESSTAALLRLTVPNLRAMAKARGVVRFSTMRKAELVSRLADLDVDEVS